MTEIAGEICGTVMEEILITRGKTHDIMFCKTLDMTSASRQVITDKIEVNWSLLCTPSYLIVVTTFNSSSLYWTKKTDGMWYYKGQNSFWIWGSFIVFDE